MRHFSLTVALAIAAAISPNFVFAQAVPDLSNLENNLRLTMQLRGVYLGVQLSDINEDRAKALKLNEERGVEVLKVEPGSPAANAGIKAGDVLLSYNGENILGAQQLGRLVSETPQGRKVKIQLWRDGKAQFTTAVIAQAHWGRDFSPDLNFPMPDIRVVMPDIPNALLVWKNPALGIECEPVDAQLAEYFGVKGGVLVRSVDKGSAAEKAGLKAGDVLTAVGDRNVTNPREVMSCVRAGRRLAKPLTIAVTREHRQLTLSVPLQADNQQ